MAKVNVNLLPASSPVWLGVALLIAAAGVGYSIWERQRLLVVLSEQQDYLAVTAERARRVAQPLPRTAVSPKAELAILGISQALTTPWLTWLDAIQQAAADEVTLSRIQPDAAARRLLLEGNATSVDAMLAFVERLNKPGTFHSIDPISMVPAPGGGIRFQVAASWQERS